MGNKAYKMKIDWQDIYDDLLIQKQIIESQISVLSTVSEICTHPVNETEYIKIGEEGQIALKCCSCNRIINKQ